MTSTIESVNAKTMDVAGQKNEPISVCLLISSLEFGGAERQVVEMVNAFDRSRVKPLICSLSHEVPLAASLTRGAADLIIVEKRGRFDITTVLRVAQLLRERRPNVVHAFLFDSEMVARLAAPLAGVPVVVASERNTDYVRRRLHKVALRLTQPLFDVMVANSFAGKAFNVRTLGLRESRIEVVHNGVDVKRFFPDREAGLAFRKQLGIPTEDPVIGIVASFKRQKGHACFLKTASRVREAFPKAWCLVVGEPLSDDLAAGSRYQGEIKQMAISLGVGDRCRFLGHQKDMNAVYNACDITALLSVHEGTPNVLLESMACEVPVIASHVADNAMIVLDSITGHVVPKDDHEAAAARVKEMLYYPSRRIQMGVAARRRISREFSMERAAHKLEEIYRKYLNRKRPKVLETHVSTPVISETLH